MTSFILLDDEAGDASFRQVNRMGKMLHWCHVSLSLCSFDLKIYERIPTLELGGVPKLEGTEFPQGQMTVASCGSSGLGPFFVFVWIKIRSLKNLHLQPPRRPPLRHARRDRNRSDESGRTDESDVEATEVPEVGGVKVIGRSRSRKQQKQQPLVNRWEHPIGFYGLAMAWPYLMGLMRR